jgi:hypothetical protein
MGKTKLVFLLSGCAVLGACASTGQSGYSKDEGKIAAVEQVAKTTGTKVYWVSYPTKRVASLPASTGG